MLIRFRVENHLSFRDRYELSLVAAPLQDKAADLLLFGDMKLIPTAIVYGANASGKSNLVSAIAYFRDIVVHSHERGGPDTEIRRAPFLLDQASPAGPTKFDIDFVVDKIRYHYGFSFNDKAIHEEWLYAFPSGKRQTWFHRDWKKKRIYFGKRLKGATRTIESLVRGNSLFLSTAAQNAHKQLTSIYQYIERIALVEPPGKPEADLLTTFRRGQIDPRIIRFLQGVDTGIVDFKFDSFVSESQRTLANDIIQLMKKHAPKGRDVNIDIASLKKISFGHSTKEGAPVFLDAGLESTGTLRLVMLLKTIFEALDRGYVVVVDELDASLHTHLSERIISLFNSKNTNKTGAQLIATTHDTNLLSHNLLRRDQVWFTEKDLSGATALYPLTDIRTRNTDNIEKGYLQGRFGAVPYRGPVELLTGLDT